MPSLDNLYQDNRFNNLKIFAVNMEQPNKQKTKKFFSDLKIKKLEIFFDKNLNFVKEFKKADQFIGITHKFDWAVIRAIDTANGVSYDCK